MCIIAYHGVCDRTEGKDYYFSAYTLLNPLLERRGSYTSTSFLLILFFSVLNYGLKFKICVCLSISIAELDN